MSTVAWIVVGFLAYVGIVLLLARLLAGPQQDAQTTIRVGDTSGLPDPDFRVRIDGELIEVWPVRRAELTE